jgi:hypothetical protein
MRKSYQLCFRFPRIYELVDITTDQVPNGKFLNIDTALPLDVKVPLWRTGHLASLALSTARMKNGTLPRFNNEWNSWGLILCNRF